MNEVWFRWAALFVPQVVILAGLWFNRRPVKNLDNAVQDLSEKVEELGHVMQRHLETHVALGKRR